MDEQSYSVCHLCKSVLMDKGVPLAELDTEKVSDWWKTETGELLDVD